jgi:pyruvate ferredoxin oxidoreductase gamma subunit
MPRPRPASVPSAWGRQSSRFAASTIRRSGCLLHSIDVFSGLNPQGYILINSTRSFEELGIAEFAARFPPHHVCDVGATDLAKKHVGRPVPNAALLGGFAAITKLLAFDSVAKAIREKFPGPVGEANVAAAREAYEIALKA